MHEYLTRNVEPVQVPGDWNVSHRYTYGVAGERFFREVMDNGRLMASRCPKCSRSFLPPTLYCEACFVEVTDFRAVESQGTVASFTVLHESLDETERGEPVVIAFVEFEGIAGGWLAPLAGVAAEKVSIGMAVKPVFKPKDQRKGYVTDITHFAPA